MSAKLPLVSVVMAARNAAPYIAQTVQSIQRQSLEDWELIVVDDASTEATAHIVLAHAQQDPRIHLVRLPQRMGQSYALNTGMGQARGKYIALFDADDLALATRLEHPVAYLEARPDLVLLGGYAQLFSTHEGDGKLSLLPVRTHPIEHEKICAVSLFQTGFISSAMTFRAALVREKGLQFDVDYVMGHDWKFSLSASQHGAVENLPEVLFGYRVHAQQLTHNLLSQDVVGCDTYRIRLHQLQTLGLRPSDEDMQVHLAISPCHYWPMGSHPYFLQRRERIAQQAEQWLGRLLEGNIQTAQLHQQTLEAVVEEIRQEVLQQAAM